MAQLKRATFVVERCRNGWYVQVSTPDPNYDPENDDYQEDIQGDPFILPGEELDPERLGKEIVASIVANQVTPKKRR